MSESKTCEGCVHAINDECRLAPQVPTIEWEWSEDRSEKIPLYRTVFGFPPAQYRCGHYEDKRPIEWAREETAPLGKNVLVKGPGCPVTIAIKHTNSMAHPNKWQEEATGLICHPTFWHPIP